MSGTYRGSRGYWSKCPLSLVSAKESWTTSSPREPRHRQWSWVATARCWSRLENRTTKNNVVPHYHWLYLMFHVIDSIDDSPRLCEGTALMHFDRQETDTLRAGDFIVRALDTNRVPIVPMSSFEIHKQVFFIAIDMAGTKESFPASTDRQSLMCLKERSSPCTSTGSAHILATFPLLRRSKVTSYPTIDMSHTNAK